MEKFKQIFAYIPSIGLLMVLCTLPYLYGGLQRFVLYFACISYLIDYVLNKRWKGWQLDKEKWVYIVFMFFYLCIPIRQLFDPSCTWLYEHKLESYLPFLVLGIMGMMGYNHTLRLEHVALAMSLTCLFFGCQLAYLMSDVVCDNFQSWRSQLNEMRISHINSHMAVNVYCNLTLVFAAWTILQSSCRVWLKWVIGLLSIGIVVGILLSEGRTGQITLAVLLMIFVIVWLWKQSESKWIVPALIALMIGGGSYWYYSPRFHGPSAYDNPRLYLWKIGVQIAKEKPLAGWGVSSARAEYVKRGLADKDFQIHYLHEYEHASMERYGVVSYEIIHPHNVCLETMMEFGIIGVLILFLCMLLPICLSPIGKLRWYLAACIFVFFMQAMFESLGTSLLPIWLPLMTFIWRYNAETKNEVGVAVS
ncbi:MAG: O-antigen ligase family protein [Paludibacteraceae bacterium]|nr:O-antigen ligase family protein [Paludibacteraceae bacterium]